MKSRMSMKAKKLVSERRTKLAELLSENEALIEELEADRSEREKALLARIKELEKGSEPVAWVTEWRDGSAEFNRRVVQFSLNVPIWVTEQYEYRQTALFKTPPTANAAVAAALIKAEEVCMDQAKEPECHERAIYCADAIRAIPRDTQALEEICLKVANLVLEEEDSLVGACMQNQLRSIVQRVLKGEE